MHILHAMKYHHQIVVYNVITLDYSHFTTKPITPTLPQKVKHN